MHVLIEKVIVPSVRSATENPTGPVDWLVGFLTVSSTSRVSLVCTKKLDGEAVTVNELPGASSASALVGPSGTFATPDPAVCHTGSTTATITGCVAGADDNGNGMGETFDYTTNATTGAGYYYIIVDSFSYNIGGDFTLTVTTH